MTDDEKKLLIETANNVKWIREAMKEHLSRHWLATLSAVSAAFVSLGAMIVALIF